MGAYLRLVIGLESNLSCLAALGSSVICKNGLDEGCVDGDPREVVSDGVTVRSGKVSKRN